MNTVRRTTLLVVATLLASCSDNTVSPRASAISMDFVYGGGATEALTASNTTRFSITIDPTHNMRFDLGAGNSLYFPAHSLCDPTKSSYGVAEWDKSCIEARSSVTVKVTAWLDSHGHARVDFDPNVRFVPSSNPTDWVILTFADVQASVDPLFNILYCRTATSGCFDETKLDPTLLTVRDPKTGRITRRIKHFSGYNVAAGDDEALNIGLSNVVPTIGSVLSVSAADLDLNDVDAVTRANPRLKPDVAKKMLDRIRIARRFFGYVLASG